MDFISINMPEITQDEAAADIVLHPAIVDIPALFREHRQNLVRFVLRYLRNSADAEDVVQSTFVEAMRNAHRFAGLSKPSTWLYGIALNLARNQVRRNCGDLLDFVEDTVLNQSMDDYADPARKAELRQTVMQVDDFLSTLNPEIRATFEAVVDGDITYEEASSELNIPIGTVRSRVSRVRSSVRAAINDGFSFAA